MLNEIVRRKQIILALLERSDVLLQAADPDIRRLAEVRWPLVRELRSYQLYKHGVIFDPLLARVGAAQAREAARLKNVCLAVATEGETFLRDWNGRQQAEWPAYRLAARALNTGLRRHLHDEHRSIQRLLAMR